MIAITAGLMLRAWRSYDRDAIVALFSDDVSYRYLPFDEPIDGAEAVADSWLENQDEPGSWDASYEPALISGYEAIATGESRYTDGEAFSNLWQLEFDDAGRCKRFVEWSVEHPEE